MSQPTLTARREFLKFLAASPYVAAFGGSAAFLGRTIYADAAQQTSGLIGDPKSALTVFDFEEAAHRNIPPGHWAYMVSGVDDDGTLRANRAAFSQVELRPRRLHDATKVDIHADILGTTYNSPIFICPVGGQKAFHPEGEVAVARAAKARGTLQVLSTVSSSSVEDVNQALGRPVWFQLYAASSWPVTEQILRRVKAAGCTVVALTVDNTTGRFSETYLRTRPKDLQPCQSCHEGGVGSEESYRSRPIYQGINMAGVTHQNRTMDWEFVDRLRNLWTGTLMIKGIDTREDARLCLEHGIDGILVSNHGGRSTETLRATLEALPEVVAEVGNRIPVYVDGGFRRGTDVFKALALGAKAVGIGRPYIWGLGAFGEAGVDRVLEIMQGELRLAMANCGTQTVADITRTYVTAPNWKI